MSTETKAMTIGDWILTLIVLGIPIVGIIMQFVWALSSDTQPSKKTFCQASLILVGILLVLGIISVVVFGGLAAVIGAQQHSNGG